MARNNVMRRIVTATLWSAPLMIGAALLSWFVSAEAAGLLPGRFCMGFMVHRGRNVTAMTPADAQTCLECWGSGCCKGALMHCMRCWKMHAEFASLSDAACEGCCPTCQGTGTVAGKGEGE